MDSLSRGERGVPCPECGERRSRVVDSRPVQAERAILKKRFGRSCELNPAYFLDGAAYCRAAAAERMAVPTLFDLDALSERKAA